MRMTQLTAWFPSVLTGTEITLNHKECMGKTFWTSKRSYARTNVWVFSAVDPVVRTAANSCCTVACTFANSRSSISLTSRSSPNTLESRGTSGWREAQVVPHLKWSQLWGQTWLLTSIPCLGLQNLCGQRLQNVWAFGICCSAALMETSPALHTYVKIQGVAYRATKCPEDVSVL